MLLDAQCCKPAEGRAGEGQGQGRDGYIVEIFDQLLDLVVAPMLYQLALQLLHIPLLGVPLKLHRFELLGRSGYRSLVLL